MDENREEIDPLDMPITARDAPLEKRAKLVRQQMRAMRVFHTRQQGDAAWFTTLKHIIVLEKRIDVLTRFMGFAAHADVMATIFAAWLEEIGYSKPATIAQTVQQSFSA